MILKLYILFSYLFILFLSLILIKGLLLVTLYLLQKTPDNFHSLHPLGWFILLLFLALLVVYEYIKFILKNFFFFIILYSLIILFLLVYIWLLYTLFMTTLVTCILHLRGLQLYCHSFRLITCFLYVPLKYTNIWYVLHKPSKIFLWI